MTAGRIILDMPNPALDRDGNPYSGAKLYFYQAGTSIALNAYTDSTLVVPLANPLVSDSAGRFVEAWGDISTPYDVKWTDANDALIYTFGNVAPLSVAVAPDGAGVHASAFRSALGLGSAALEDTGSNGHVVPFLDAANNWTDTQNFVGDVTKNGLDMGYLGLPPNLQNADYTFVLTDAGKRVLHTSGSAHTYTIPKDADVPYDLGATIVIRNRGSGALTIARSTGVVLWIAGASTDANVTVAAYGFATLVNEAADEWVIMGVGVS